MRRANGSLRLSKEARDAKSEGKRVGREAAAKWRKVYGDPSEPSHRLGYEPDIFHLMVGPCYARG